MTNSSHDGWPKQRFDLSEGGEPLRRIDAPGALRHDSATALVRVWLVIAAVWLVFWAPVAALLFASFDSRPDEFAVMGLLILAPPLSLLAAGAAGLLAADAIRTLAATRRRSPR